MFYLYKGQIISHCNCWTLTPPERSSGWRSRMRHWALGKTGRTCLQIVRFFSGDFMSPILVSARIYKSTKILHCDLCPWWPLPLVTSSNLLQRNMCWLHVFFLHQNHMYTDHMYTNIFGTVLLEQVCVLDAVRPSIRKHWSLEQRSIYCRAMQGDEKFMCYTHSPSPHPPPLSSLHRGKFSKEFLKTR